MKASKKVLLGLLGGAGATEPPDDPPPGTLDFSLATGDNTALLALLEDI